MQIGEKMLDCNGPRTYSSQASGIEFSNLSLEHETRLRVFGLLWAWCDARNKANSGENMPATGQIVYKAQSINFDSCMNRQEKVFNPPKEKLLWCPPKPKFLKINFDGAFH